MKEAGQNSMVKVPLGFHPVIHLPDEYWVYDFSKGPQSDFDNPFAFTIGKYDETRPGMYTTPLFGGVRNHHVGLDIGAPIDTPIFAFAGGTIHSFGVNSEDGSYGPTIITHHQVSLPISVGSPHPGPLQDIWVLYGHLSHDSLNGLYEGQEFEAGEQLAAIGDENENGGWPPHLHLQVSVKKPVHNDLPGVVRADERESALKEFLDPRLLVGPVY
ncbi:MAG: peptidase M23 [Candidatus Poseidoniales archaeon]|nr:peptidase M23 [Euryarchaeota archaeon]RJU90623.1 MAG: peptidase M23 [Candidatus Poseidoniales archaeon]